MTYSNEHLNGTVPLSSSAHRFAENHWECHENIQKSNQVFLNTLAVYAVHCYLQRMGIETDLAASYSWNPEMQSCIDVADLEVINLGKLECRPVWLEAQVCLIPPEVRENRIGYVVVRINESLREARILGFSETASTGNLEIGELQSLEVFLEHLEPLRSVAPINIPVNLSQWSQNVFEAGWQSMEALLDTDTRDRAFIFRGKAVVERVKLIDLGMQLGGQHLDLVVGLMPAAEEPEMEIWVEVRPTGGQTHLPPDLQLMVLKEEGTVILEGQARKTMNIRLEFSGERGERFSVQVALGDFSVTELISCTKSH